MKPARPDVLLMAVAGRADTLVTKIMRDFRRGNILEFDRAEIFVFTAPDRHLVVGKLGIAAHWLLQRIVPDWNLVPSRGGEFHPRVTGLEEP